jgi:hypothetical protein
MMSLALAAVKLGDTVIEIHGSDRLDLYRIRMKMKQAAIDKDATRNFRSPDLWFASANKQKIKKPRRCRGLILRLSGTTFLRAV